MNMSKADDPQAALRATVLELLHNEAAHVNFQRAVAGLGAKLRGARPAGQPHTPWRLVEHMRLAQHDIVEFILDPDFISPPWPEGYWPQGDAPPDGRAWRESVKAFERDAERLRRLIADPETDLLAPLAHAPDYTILREAMLVIDHTAYHLGQLILVRRLLDAWE